MRALYLSKLNRFEIFMQIFNPIGNVGHIERNKIQKAFSKEICHKVQVT